MGKFSQKILILGRKRNSVKKEGMFFGRFKKSGFLFCKEKPLVRVTFPRKTTELREVVFLGKSRERVVFSALNNVARHSRNSKVIIQLHSPLFVEIQLYFFLLIWIRHDVSSLFVSSKPFETKDSNCVQKSTIV